MDIPHAIIARRRAGRPLCRNNDHWVTLTVNVNITDLDRGEWIVKSITRSVTARTNLSGLYYRRHAPLLLSLYSLPFAEQ